MASCPIIPMAVLSGAPSREEIFEYLRQMHAVGIDEIMLYPRKGCEIAYATDAWREMVQNVLDALSSLGMGVYLNDDFHFPSGNANGAVTANDAFCLKSVTVRGEKKGQRNLVGSETPRSARFADVLNDEAMDAFLASSHEWYYQNFEPYFGSVIRGFYTDEPSVSYACGKDDMPYYFGMEDDYRAQFGRDFDEDLQAEEEHFLARSYELIAARFAKCYPEKIAGWCDAHGVKLAGHLYEDHSPITSAFGNGDLTRALPKMGLPGVDEISTNLCDRHLLSLLGAADYARKDGAMAELFALGPCDMPFAKQIAMIYLCAAFGIDHYFLAVSHMNMMGNRPINNYFSHFGPARPDFQGIALLCEEAKRAAHYAAVGFAPEVYVRYPVTRWTKHMTDLQSDKPPRDECFTDVLAALSHAQIEWRYLSEREEAPAGVPVIALGDGDAVLLDGRELPLPKIVSLLRKPPRVTTADGELPEALFVRKRADGGLLVIDRSGEAGDYRIDGAAVHLDAFGVYTEPAPAWHTVSALPDGTALSVAYADGNMARPMFLNDETAAHLVCERDVTATFCVCEECEAFLDGVRLGGGVCRRLGVGLDELYRESAPMFLAKGEHEIISTGGDYKYLPSVILNGEFSVRYDSEARRVTLGDRANTVALGECVTDHGCVSFTLTCEIPADATAILLNGEPLYTEVFFDGKPLGARCAPPYRFALPADARGRRTIRIEQRSSLASLFGDVDYFNYHQNAIRWRSTKPSHPSRFGVDGIAFLRQDGE